MILLWWSSSWWWGPGHGCRCYESPPAKLFPRVPNNSWSHSKLLAPVSLIIMFGSLMTMMTICDLHFQNLEGSSFLKHLGLEEKLLSSHGVQRGAGQHLLWIIIAILQLLTILIIISQWLASYWKTHLNLSKYHYHQQHHQYNNDDLSFVHRARNSSCCSLDLLNRVFLYTQNGLWAYAS